MGLYSVVLKPSVEKDFRQLPKNVLTRVIRLIEGLATNPFPYNSVKLSGTRELYRLTTELSTRSTPRGNWSSSITSAIDEKLIAEFLRFAAHREATRCLKSAVGRLNLP